MRHIAAILLLFLGFTVLHINTQRASTAVNEIVVTQISAADDQQPVRVINPHKDMVANNSCSEDGSQTETHKIGDKKHYSNSFSSDISFEQVFSRSITLYLRNISCANLSRQAQYIRFGALII